MGGCAGGVGAMPASGCVGVSGMDGQNGASYVFCGANDVPSQKHNI